MNTIRAFVPAFGAGFLVTFVPGGQAIVFQPGAGTTASKSFSIQGEFSLDSLSLIVDGSDMGGMLGGLEVDVTQGTKIEVTDVYKELEEGRPKELLRTFQELSGSLEMHVSMPGTEVQEIPTVNTSGELEGKTVAFRWNNERGEYDIAFQECEGPAELLESLSEDMDLRAFLPGKEVTEDETWTVELKALASVGMPGGNLHMTPDGGDVDADELQMFEELFEDLGDKFSDLLEGDCTCTFEGVREEHDARLAEIAIKIEVASTLDLSEFLQRVVKKGLDQGGVGENVDFSIDAADMNLDFEGTGTLLWDLRSGRLHSFQLGGDVSFGIDLELNIEAGGQSHAMDASLEMSGSLQEEVETQE